jgi:hypothetical protein
MLPLWAGLTISTAFAAATCARSAATGGSAGSVSRSSLNRGSTPSPVAKAAMCPSASVAWAILVDTASVRRLPGTTTIPVAEMVEGDMSVPHRLPRTAQVLAYQAHAVLHMHLGDGSKWLAFDEPLTPDQLAHLESVETQLPAALNGLRRSVETVGAIRRSESFGEGEEEVRDVDRIARE